MMSCKTRSIGEFVLCNFCNDQVAFLYCLVDSAKLCLRCDQQVHSANEFCHRHLRLPICDNCGTEPVSILCATDKLVLCERCDQDVHGSCPLSATHVRKPIGAFSCSPSLIEIASAWGLNVQDKSLKRPHVPVDSGSNLDNAFLDSLMSKKEVSSLGLLEDVIVPNHCNPAVIYSDKEGGGGSSGGRDDQLEPRTSDGSSGGFLDSWMSDDKEVSPSGSSQDLIVPDHDNPAVITSNCGEKLTKEEKQLLRSLEMHLMDHGDDRWSSSGGGKGFHFSGS